MAEAYLGIYADSQGTTPCATISPPAQITLYLIAKLDTTEVSSIAGAEYRIEISNPSGWLFSYNGPAGLPLGDPLDTLPDSADTSGLTIAFDPCLVPVGNQVALGTITATNFGAGGTTELRVRRHSNPTNATYACPVFTVCDTPVFSLACMSPSTEAACHYEKLRIASLSDPIVFVFPLELAPGTQATSFRGLVAEPVTADIVGSMPGYAKSSLPVISDVELGFWDFEGGAGSCNTSGWEEVDNRAIEEGIPYGEWGRLFSHVTDNSLCTENTTCAWLWSDDGSVDGNPTLYNDPAMSFGPDGYVIRGWLDNAIISPWVSLVDEPVGETILTFREFPGNSFALSRIMRGVSVRGRVGTGPPTAWDGPAWKNLGDFAWVTRTENLSQFMERDWTSFQVRFRVTDHQLFGASPPSPRYIPGPGPFFDDVRIGRPVHEAPVIAAGEGDTRWQAQDAFPSSAMGPYYAPITDRFGSCAFSMAADLHGNDFAVIPGDSIAVEVKNLGHGTIDQVRFLFSIVSGPHAGQVPPGATQLGGGLCEWPVTQVGVGDKRFVDPPDNYFRGGDVVHYFWWARDEHATTQTGVSSSPKGIVEPNIASMTLAQAEAATGGLYEVSFLPTIDWDPAYLARIHAGLEGDGPTSGEIANSSQRSCILYINKVNTARRSGTVNRTSFLYTLDRLGYSGYYDVYDVQGFGDTNNDLGSRATPVQGHGYSLIVHDAGSSKLAPLPDGSDPLIAKVNQASWYQDWLNNAMISEAGQATLWIIGDNVVETISTNSLITSTMGVLLRTTLPGADSLLTVKASSGSTSSNSSDFTWARPGNDRAQLFQNRLSLSNACPDKPEYDGLRAGLSSSEATHWFFWERISQGVQIPLDGAVVLNANYDHEWNTIMMSFSWSDIVDLFDQSPSAPAISLARNMLSGALPDDCLRGVNPATDTAEEALPRVTRLYQNVPNPFNPRTTIRLDLATKERVELRILDVAGRLVRTLVDGLMPAKQHEIVWDGRDERGQRVASGIYFYRLSAGDFHDTRKLVMLK